MKKKVDIGTLVKEKLEGLNQGSDAPQWDAVLDTLELRQRNRNRLWWVGSILCAIVLVVGLSFFNKASDTSGLEVLTEQEASSKELVTNDTLTEDNSAENIATSQELVNNKQAAIENQEKEDKDLKTQPSQVSVTEFDSIDPSEGATVKTTYYYYRDTDNTEVVTKDVTLIDSLLQKSQRNVAKDSLQ